MSKVITVESRGEGPGHRWQVSLPSKFAEMYRVGESMGCGAMGSVFRATQIATGRDVAIKFMRDPDDAEHVQRFLREGQAMAKLAHPGVLRVLDCGAVAGSLYLVMELHEGGTLKQLMSHGELDPRRAVEIAIEVCEALAVCHAAGVVHRDFKPANVLMASDGRPVIADFGLVTLAESPSLTATGLCVGTPMYMAPEQADGKPASPEMDVFAVGAVLYEMLSGLPARVVGMGGVRAKAARERFARAAPPGVTAVIDRAMQTDPARRPTASLMATALRAALEPAAYMSGFRQGSGGGEVARPRRRAHPVAVAVVCAALAFAAAYGVAGRMVRRTALPPSPDPQPTWLAPSPGPSPGGDRAALERIAARCPPDPYHWLAKTLGDPLRHSRDRTHSRVLGLLAAAQLHADLSCVLDRPDDPPLEPRDAWAAAGWILLVERTLESLGARWPYRWSFEAALARAWPGVGADALSAPGWETHVRGVVNRELDLRFQPDVESIAGRRVFYPYTIRLARQPGEARVWFGLTNPQRGFAVLARINGHLVPIPPPDARATEVEHLYVTPASIEGEILCRKEGDGMQIFAGQGYKRAYFVGRGIPASWLSAGGNAMEVSTVPLDGSVIYETAPAVWIKALAVR